MASTTATNNNETLFEEQLQALQQRFPHEPTHKLLRLLRRHEGNVDQVKAILLVREFRVNKLDTLEQRYGEALNELIKENPSGVDMPKRARLLKIMERFGGELAYVRAFLLKFAQKKEGKGQEGGAKTRREQREEQKSQYASQLAELEQSGINVKCPCVLKQLEKHGGDTAKVRTIMQARLAKKKDKAQLETQYASQLAQLLGEKEVEVKNKRVLTHLLRKANGDVDLVKQFLVEKKNKRACMRRARSSEGEAEEEKTNKKQKSTSMSPDDLDEIKKLRAAGLHGNPVKLLALFHECKGNLELTKQLAAETRAKREEQREERLQKRAELEQAVSAYHAVTHADDWPAEVQQVYLDGNNMMFVVDSLRRLCLNRAGKRTEKIIGQIASAWQDKMALPNVDLIFDSTRQLEPIGSVRVSSAQPAYKTTDEWLVELAKANNEGKEKKKTVVVTGDRALASQLQGQGCILVKPYQWFAHCVMVLTPDLVKETVNTRSEATTTTTAEGRTGKVHYDFDELIKRVAHIDL